MLPAEFWFMWPGCYRGKYSNKSISQKQKLPVAVMFVNESGQYENFFRGPSIDTIYKVSAHLAQRFQRKSCFFFRNRPIRNKNCLWRPCLLMDRD